MSDEARGADSIPDDDLLRVDPAHADDSGVLPPVWALSDRMRDLVKKSNPDKDERAALELAVVRQLRTALAYEVVVTSIKAHATGNKRPTPVLYVILFPGEGRDNTGMKDLNDKVIGYNRHNKYILERQQHIRTIFTQSGFIVVGQDYKTSLILGFTTSGKGEGSLDANRKIFDECLRKLDGALRDSLLVLLKDAESSAQYKEEAQKLRKILEKDPKYRFDIFYGLSEGPGATLVA